MGRDQGFKPGEMQTSVAKRRYRLANTQKSQQLQFIHYFPTEVKVPITIQPQKLQKPMQQAFTQRQPIMHQQFQQSSPQSQPKKRAPPTAAPELNENFRFVGGISILYT